MPDISRRRFLRNASVGAAAAGVVAVGGTGVFSAVTNGASAAPLKYSASDATPSAEGSDIFAHVADAKTGRMSLFVGNKTIEFTDVDLAQQLMRVAQ